MYPLLLKGHERPLTVVKYNRDGDLLFSCSKDYKPTVWYVENGERLGTFNGHKGTVWDCDISFETKDLLTASSDCSVRLWDIETGTQRRQWDHKAGVRSVMWSHGEKMILTVQDNQYTQQPTIFVYNVDSDDEKEPVRELFVENNTTKMNCALWGPLNSTIISCDDDGVVRLWDVEKGVQVSHKQEHKKAINSMQFSKDQTMFVTASADMSAKLWDTRTLKCIKTYQSDRPINAAAISPLMNHVILGGGQEARNVTTTRAAAGHFEVDFYHTIFQTKMGQVKGHFGPVNTLAFSPDGKSYASGAEDGYIRLHHFDKDYFNSN